MKTMTYQWRSSIFKRFDPQIVGEYLEKVKAKSKLTPRSVVEAARSKSSPIHGCFEWDDRKASDLYRLVQARAILGSIEVTVQVSKQKTPTVTRAFVHVSGDAVDDGAEYIGIRTAMANPRIRKQVLADALGELVSWRTRYEHLKELARVFSAIDEVEALQLTSS
jgi:hypothetical protein